MTQHVQLIHSIHKSRLDEIRRAGMKAESEFDDLGLDIRRGVVYCWLSKDDDKLSSNGQKPHHVYVEVTVEADRCRVADMEYSSLALMYRQGSGGKPKNHEASALFADIYRTTSVPLPRYRPGMFFTPEVVVKGNIAPECIRVLSDQDT